VREILFWNNYVQVLREQANRIIAISEHTRGTLIEHFDMDERKIDVVYHGLSPYWSAPADVPTVSERIRKATAVPYILFVGGFDPRKNFPKLIQALWLIPPERRPRLLVAGGRSKSNKKDHARLPRIGQMDVHFLEYISDDDLRWLYSQALCLAFPSHEEGWGFPIVEAMAAGTPVVCADHGSMREAAGGAAITTNVNRVEELSHALSIPIESSSIRDERVAAGRERVQSLTWKACAQSVSDVYENALS
jgi:glycosyltransferase involved in cell wall biosynthesis